MEKDQSKKIALEPTTFPEIPEALVQQISDYRQLMMMYNSAILEITTKLEILNDELSMHQNTPIQFIKSRVKQPQSIVAKLKRLNKSINNDSIVSTLNDVAGIRVVCSFIDDVYKISEMLTKQDDIRVIEIKDYIKNPKANGYRSYHLIVEVPVYFSNKKQGVRVEIQIRTVAMDFWASLEHQFKYKEDVDLTNDLEKELKECAETIADTDKKMMAIRNKIHKSNV